MKKIYVGNLPFSATEDEVRELFGRHGEVSSVSLITDRETGKPRGFGFVEMSSDEAGQAAITVRATADNALWAEDTFVVSVWAAALMK